MSGGVAGMTGWLLIIVLYMYPDNILDERVSEIYSSQKECEHASLRYVHPIDYDNIMLGAHCSTPEDYLKSREQRRSDQWSHFNGLLKSRKKR